MKLLQIYNAGAHYRAPIFMEMSKAFHCDFVFGDSNEDIKKMDYSLLSGHVTEIHNLRLGKILYYQRGVLKYLSKNYDTYIVLGDQRCLSTWLFLILSMTKRSKRVFLWSHGWYGREGIIKRILGRIFYGMSDGAFIYNNRSRRLMIDGGIKAQKLHTIYNSLNYDKQLAIRQRLIPSTIYKDHFDNSNPNIIFIGRLTSVKRLDLLLSAVLELKNKDWHCNVTFVGDGVEKENLVRQAEELGISNYVWFYGACYDENKNAELVYNADLCVSPGNIGLTAMHALMFGCPAVTNNDFNHQMPEFEAIQEGKTGTFFENNNAVSLAQSIQQWFSENQNRDEIRFNCYSEIDRLWNPHNQMEIFKSVLLK